MKNTGKAQEKHSKSIGKVQETKEFAVRASDEFFEGDVQSPTLIKYFKTIATAAVSTSAYEAYDLNYLKEGRDFVSVNTPMNIGLAKDKVLQLSKNYMPPSVREDIEVLGRGGLSVLYSAINEFRLGEYMSDYDVEIARKIAYVICGGEQVYVTLHVFCLRVYVRTCLCPCVCMRACL